MHVTVLAERKTGLRQAIPPTVTEPEVSSEDPIMLNVKPPTVLPVCTRKITKLMREYDSEKIRACGEILESTGAE